MKKRALLFLTLICCQLSAQQCSSPKSPSKNQVPGQIQDQGGDQTDIYAIPLDSSEAEENQEMESLEKESKKQTLPSS